MQQTLSLRPHFEAKIVGHLLDVLGKSYYVAQKPTYTVVRFLSDEDFNRKSQGIESKWLVRESLTLISGEKIIVNYIKSAH